MGTGGSAAGSAGGSQVGTVAHAKSGIATLLKVNITGIRFVNPLMEQECLTA
eukprot:gene27214-33506_t